MAENINASNKVVIQLLEKNKFIHKVAGSWIPSLKAITGGGKVRALSGGKWYPVWKPSSTVVKKCFQKAWKIREKLEDNFEYDSGRELFYINPYISVSSGNDQDRFSEMILELKKKKESSFKFFMKKLQCLQSLDFYVCAIPGHDPKESTGVQKLAKKISEEMLCRNLSQYLQRKWKVERQHKLSKSEKRSPAEEAKTLKLTKTDKFKGKRILLIDDITTSGGTIRGSRKFILSNTSAKEVHVLVLGKTKQ
jgi:predicted amidophosphoribosyltransferase